MSPDDREYPTEIGATLRDARRRLGLEVREVEERTKIRAKYLRALENEDWETLPAPAYVRGFLRSYGQVLGIDGEMLADEFRRRFGEGTAPPGPSPSEPLLSERRRGSDRTPSRGRLILGVIAALAILLLLLSLLSGSDDPEPAAENSPAKGQKQGKKNANKKNNNGNGGSKNPEPAPLKKVDATVLARTNIDVCLVAGSDTALIDGQVLQAGTEEPYDAVSKRYRLDLRSPGTVRFTVGKTDERLEVSEPTSFEADSRGIAEIGYKGPDCP
jgi:cytoskeletal protein RodZ